MASLTVLSLDDPVDASLAAINGNFSALNDELAGKAAASHGHDASAIVSGVLAAARLGSGSPTSGTFLRGDGAWQQVQWQDMAGRPTSFPPEVHSHDGSEIATGTVPLARLGGGTPSASTFLRGDQTWQAVSWDDITGKPGEAWQLISAGIAYVGGLVGIGTSSPEVGLHVQGRRLLVHFDDWGNWAVRLRGQKNTSNLWGEYDIVPHWVGMDFSNPQVPRLMCRIGAFGEVTIGANLLLPAQTSTPANPSVSSGAKIYVKGSKLVVQFNDAGTVRYKWLDLTGTGTTWQHSTSAP